MMVLTPIYFYAGCYLPAQQNVLFGLWHGTVSSRHHQNTCVHFGCSRDHILHVIDVAWTVDVC